MRATKRKSLGGCRLECEERRRMANIGIVDIVVLVSYIAGAVLLGVWLGRGKQDAKTYLLGGNDAPWWAILGSIVATETSTVTFLSVPGLAFKEGGDFRFLQLALGFLIGRFLIVAWLLPLYFRGQLFTVYQLLRDRFGSASQKFASIIFLVTRNLGDGLRLFLTALVLNATLGWSLPACVVAIGLATIVFTVTGGMKSVIWNDCIQLAVYILGGIVALLVIVAKVEGGFEGLFQFAQETGRTRVFDFPLFGEEGLRFSEGFTFWAGIIGGAVLTIGTHGTDQMFVQRALSARSQRDAGRALAMSGFVVFWQFALFLVVGVALASFYSQNPPEQPFEKSDRVFCTFIVNEMPRNIGLVGLLLAAVFSAAMSTLSSSLNSSSSAVVNDLLFPNADQVEDKKIVFTSRLLTVVFGFAQIAIGILAANFNDSVVNYALAIAGFSAGLLLGLFALGALAKKANQRSAIIGLFCGLGVLLLCKFGGIYLPESEASEIVQGAKVVGTILPSNQQRVVVKLAGDKGDCAVEEFGSAPRRGERYVFEVAANKNTDGFWPLQLVGSAYRQVAWPWFPVLGSLATFLGGWLASYLP